MQFSTVFILVAATLTTVQGNGSQLGVMPQYGSQGGAPAPYGSQGGAQPQYGSQGGTQPQYGSQGGTQPQYGSQGGTQPQYGSQGGTQPQYGSQTPTQPQYGSQGGAQPQYGSQGGTQPQYGSQTPTQPPYGSQTPAQPQYGSQAPTQPQYGSQTPAAPYSSPAGLPNPYTNQPPNGQEEVDPYANQFPLPEEDQKIIPDIQCTTDNTRVQSTYPVGNTCSPDGFCLSRRFGLYNEKTGTCMTGKSYQSIGMRFKKLFGKKVDPKIRLSTHKCSMGMAFKQASEHTFGWRTAAQSGDGTHLNLVHYPSSGGTLCAVKRKKVTFFYPCDDCHREASRYTLSALSKRGAYQIQLQPSASSRRGRISCLTANYLSHKVTSQACGGLLCYTHQQWRPVSCN